MAYSESILSRAEARLKQAQQAHRDRQDRQRRAIYQALPRTEEINSIRDKRERYMALSQAAQDAMQAWVKEYEA